MSAITMNQNQVPDKENGPAQPGDVFGDRAGIINNSLKQLLTADPFPINELDGLVQKLNTGTEPERKLAQEILVVFKENENSWNKVDCIITNSNQQETKYFALQTLEHTIQKQWKILPREQCEGIKNFIIGIIIKLCENTESMKAQKLYLNKLNIVLVKIIKQDWPQHWPTALSDIVGAARQGEALCQNNLEVLRLLSEEIFIFAENEMVQSKIKHMKEAMLSEFSKVFELCYYVMENSDNEQLVLTCLKTLLRFTTWIPDVFFFKTELIDKLTTRLLPYHGFRTDALACLTEIVDKAPLTKNQQELEKEDLNKDLVSQKILNLYLQSFKVITEVIPHDIDLKEAYKKGTDSEQKLIQNLAIFLTTFATNCQTLVEEHSAYRLNDNPSNPEISQQFLLGLQYLVSISYIDDVEVFKVCLDFWNNFCGKLYQKMPASNHSGVAQWGNWNGQDIYKDVYANLLKDLRQMMVCKMAKPEEVLVGVNDQGEVVRTRMKDTANELIYATCRKTLVYLTHLDSNHTEDIMCKKLSKQVDDSEWNWEVLNTLCWSIGSISGAMTEDHERKFLVSIIKDLLGLCEQKRGKDNKAIIATNIMYVVGQYPRFLKNHWKFLKTVVNKLFEFMHESHDGVQDMACDTFSKIAQKCKSHFVQLQSQESEPFIDVILSRIMEHVQDLQGHQQHSFYEAVGYMVAAQKDPTTQQNLISKYMDLPNRSWNQLLEQSIGNPNIFVESGSLRTLSHILRTNTRACTALGHAYIHQLSRIFTDMLKIYVQISIQIKEACAINPINISDEKVKEMRLIKRESLLLINEWINHCTDPEVLKTHMVGELLQATLEDYSTSIPEAREPEVINCAVAIISKLREQVDSFISPMFMYIFEPTIAMISKSDSVFPEHRTNFFKFLSAINENAFQSMLSMNQTQFKLVLDAIIWGMKQMMQECKETSIKILENLLLNVANSQLVPYDQAQQFYKTYYMFILDHVFEVSTNILHAHANLREHAKLLAYMIKTVCGKCHVKGTLVDNISVPLASEQDILADAEKSNNQTFTYIHIRNLLHNQFGSHLTPNQITVFVEGVFTLYDETGEFISHVRDFLIQMKSKRGEDTEDLFLEERMKQIKEKKDNRLKNDKMALSGIPGMSNPYEDEEINQLTAFRNSQEKNDIFD